VRAILAGRSGFPGAKYSVHFESWKTITAVQAAQAGALVQPKTKSFPERSTIAAIRYCIAPWSVMKSAHVSTPGASLMEYISVRVKNQPNIQVGVLINGQRNGTTGALITLGSPGWVFISVDLPNARQQNVNVTNTTATHPMEIEIDCD
jgi:hypothetical protein